MNLEYRFVFVVFVTWDHPVDNNTSARDLHFPCWRHFLLIVL